MALSKHAFLGKHRLMAAIGVRNSREVLPREGDLGDLWMKAKALLTDEDRRLLDSQTRGSSGIVSEIFELAKDKADESRRKRWTCKFGSRKIVLHDVFTKIVKWTKKFEEAGDFLVSMDVSGHAAMPWSIVKFVIDVRLPTRSRDLKRKRQLTLRRLQPEIAKPMPRI